MTKVIAYTGRMPKAGTLHPQITQNYSSKTQLVPHDLGLILENWEDLTVNMANREYREDIHSCHLTLYGGLFGSDMSFSHK